MSTIMTRVLEKLRIGHSEAGRITTDDRGNNVWEWKDADNATPTQLVRKLDNEALRIADTQMWRKEDLQRKAAVKPQAELSLSDDAAAGPRPAADSPARSGRKRFGRKTDAGGGFNPYG